MRLLTIWFTFFPVVYVQREIVAGYSLKCGHLRTSGVVNFYFSNPTLMTSMLLPAIQRRQRHPHRRLLPLQRPLIQKIPLRVLPLPPHNLRAPRRPRQNARSIRLRHAHESLCELLTIRQNLLAAIVYCGAEVEGPEEARDGEEEAALGYVNAWA